MRINILLLAIISITISVNGQLNNTSFENWENPMLHKTINVTGTLGTTTFYLCDDFDYNELENWSSINQISKASNLGGFELVSESSNSIDGAKSVKIETKSTNITGWLLPGCIGLSQSFANETPGLIVNGSFVIDAQALVDSLAGGSGLNALNPFEYPGAGEAIDFIPKTISGFYKYTGGIDGSDVDSCIIVSGLKKNGVLIGHVTQRFGNASLFTPFSISYEHLNCETPDTIITLISSSSINLEIVNGEFVINSDFTGIDGSVLFIDALHIDTITPSEFPPLLQDDTASIFTYEVATVAVQGNDQFCDNVTITPQLFYSGSEGTAIVNANDEIEFTPSIGYSGVVNIPYYNCNSFSLCDTAILVLIVYPIAPCEAFDDGYSMDMNTTITKNPRLNDNDCGTTISLVVLPTNGTASLDFTGNLKYEPTTSYSGTDFLKYSICSALQATQCDTATVTYSIISTGINEIPASQINLFPNPAKNTLNIAVESTSLIDVKIFNTLGKEILKTSFNNSKAIDVNKIPNGLYFVEIETEGKKSVLKVQIIK